MTSAPANRQSFKLNRLLGAGGYGRVEVVFKSDLGNAYALKRQSIAMLSAKSNVTKAVAQVKLEKEICTGAVRSPFLVDAG